MTQTRWMLAGALLLAACGGAEEPAEDEAAVEPETTTGDEAEAAPEPAEARAYGANPLLNVYVQGPDPDGGEALEGTPDDFHASIVVTNTGDAPIDVQYANVRLEAYRDGELVECGPRRDALVVDGPDSLGPGEAFTYRGTLHCEETLAGGIEVRAYMTFEAGTPTLDRERHYCGSYTVD